MANAEFAADRRVLDDRSESPFDRALARLFAIDPAESLFERRSFPATPARARLEGIGAAFIAAYNVAIRARGPETTLAVLESRPVAERGFLAEGAAMGAAIRTACLPWRDTLSPLLAALDDRYAHLAHVGVGWAMARLPFARRRLMRRLDPMLAPLAFDGWGFHDGYFHAGEMAAGQRAMAGKAGRIYDQGAGRSLWFSCGADPARIGERIAGLGEDRRSDLWAGVGLACVYAGGSDADAIERLLADSGARVRWLRQGAAFAIGARARAGAVPFEAAATARRICRLDAEAVTTIVGEAFAIAQRNPAPQPEPYQEWRRRVADAIEARAA